MIPREVAEYSARIVCTLHREERARVRNARSTATCSAGRTAPFNSRASCASRRRARPNVARSLPKSRDSSVSRNVRSYRAGETGNRDQWPRSARWRRRTRGVSRIGVVLSRSSTSRLRILAGVREVPDLRESASSLAE